MTMSSRPWPCFGRPRGNDRRRKRIGTRRRWPRGSHVDVLRQQGSQKPFARESTVHQRHIAGMQVREQFVDACPLALAARQHAESDRQACPHFPGRDHQRLRELAAGRRGPTLAGRARRCRHQPRAIHGDPARTGTRHDATRRLLRSPPGSLAIPGGQQATALTEAACRGAMRKIGKQIEFKLTFQHAADAHARLSPEQLHQASKMPDEHPTSGIRFPDRYGLRNLSDHRGVEEIGEAHGAPKKFGQPRSSERFQIA